MASPEHRICYLFRLEVIRAIHEDIPAFFDAKDRDSSIASLKKVFYLHEEAFVFPSTRFLMAYLLGNEQLCVYRFVKLTERVIAIHLLRRSLMARIKRNPDGYSRKTAAVKNYVLDKAWSELGNRYWAVRHSEPIDFPISDIRYPEADPCQIRVNILGEKEKYSFPAYLIYLLLCEVWLAPRRVFQLKWVGEQDEEEEEERRINGVCISLFAGLAKLFWSDRCFTLSNEWTKETREYIQREGLRPGEKLFEDEQLLFLNQRVLFEIYTAHVRGINL